MLQVLFVLVVLALAVVVQVEVLAREAAVLLDPEDHLLEADGVDLEEGDKEIVKPNPHNNILNILSNSNALPWNNLSTIGIAILIYYKPNKPL